MSRNLNKEEKLVRVITNQSRLEASHSDDPEFWSRVEAALDGWEEELQHQGIRVQLVCTDSLADTNGEAEAENVRRYLIDLQEEKKADYSCILGGDDIIPFYRLPDPVEDITNDHIICSDDPYVSYEDDYLYKPKHPIGRFPHGQGRQDDLVVELLQRATRLHRAGWDSVNRLALTTQAWRLQSRATWPAMSHWYECPPCRVPSTDDNPSPPHVVGPGLLAGRTLHYYNLHGRRRDNDNWLGECNCEWILGAHGGSPLYLDRCRPLALTVAEIPLLPPSVIFSGACYGGFIPGPKPARNLALGFFREGAMAFIGSTARSYTVVPLPDQDPSASLRYSDLLAQNFLQLVEANQARSPGRRIGEIVQAIKDDYHLTYRFSHRPIDFKTLWELVLYGDPTLIPFYPVTVQEKAYASN
ncbi:MAG: C25 family cysteine peptidase [Anaerolineae bacterium]